MKKEKGKVFIWRMQKPCDNCPFVEGSQIRATLRRIPEMEREQLAGKHFMCHETTRATGNNTNLVCAGALDFQHKHGVTSAYEQVCTSMECCNESRKEMFRRLKAIARSRQP